MSSIFFTDNELLLFVISECILGCHSNPATSHIGVRSFEFSACLFNNRTTWIDHDLPDCTMYQRSR